MTAPHDDLDRRVRTGLAYTANNTGQAHLGTDQAARADAIGRVMGFLAGGFAPWPPVRGAAPDTPALFTRALLHTHLGDLIRDIDPSELGLFRLQNPPNDEPSVTRTEFTPATPLRKQAARREQQKGDLEPEIYAQAARKYVEQ